MFLDQQIVEYLVAKRKLSGKQAGQLLAAAEGQSLELIMVERGMLDKHTVLQIKSLLTELRPVDLGVVPVDLQIVKLLPASMSRKFAAVVYGVEDERLLVASANPTDPFARYYISMRTNREIEIRVAYIGDVQTLQDMAYPADEPEVMTPLQPMPPLARKGGVGMIQEATNAAGHRRVSLSQDDADAPLILPDAHSEAHSLVKPAAATRTTPPAEPVRLAALDDIEAIAETPIHSVRPITLGRGKSAQLPAPPDEEEAPQPEVPPLLSAAPTAPLVYPPPPLPAAAPTTPLGQHVPPAFEPPDDLPRPGRRSGDLPMPSRALRPSRELAPPPTPEEPSSPHREPSGELGTPPPRPKRDSGSLRQKSGELPATVERPQRRSSGRLPSPAEEAPPSASEPPPEHEAPRRPIRRSLELPAISLAQQEALAAKTRVDLGALPPVLAESTEGELQIDLVWVEEQKPPAREGPAAAPLAPSPRPAPELDVLVSGINLLDVVAEASNRLADSGQLSEVVAHVLRTARQLTGADATAFLLCQADHRYISYNATDGGNQEATTYAVPYDDTTLPGWTILHGQPLSTPSLRGESRFNTTGEKAAGLPTGATTCVPVRWGAAIIGGLLAAREEDGVEVDIRPLQLLAAPLGAAVYARNRESEMHEIRMETVQTLLDWHEAVTPGARQHGAEVAQLATGMARCLDMPAEDIEVLCFAALLHDMGLVPDRDRDLQEHTQQGAHLLQKIRIMERLVPLIRYHHERFDGSGPHRLSGQTLPLGVRVLAVAEAYIEEGLHKLPREAPELIAFEARFGTEFDPDLKAAFLRGANLDEANPPPPL